MVKRLISVNKIRSLCEYDSAIILITLTEGLIIFVEATLVQAEHKSASFIIGY